MNQIAENMRSRLGNHWLPMIYRDKIRPQRTRSVHLDVAQKENKPDILHTLLGVELKVGNRRFSCPDLATARYLRVFARLGCRDLAIPYDITKISMLADELETSWQQTVLLLNEETRGEAASAVRRQRAALVRNLREEIAAIGPGEMMPAFDRQTRRRAD